MTAPARRGPAGAADRLSAGIDARMPAGIVTLIEQRGPGIVRIVAVVAQAATILITWRLWEVRESPPLLPAVDLVQLDIAWPLLGSLALVLLLPRAGTAIHVALLALAMAMDQTRMQPYSISIAFVMAGTLPLRWAADLACAHLVALWFFAGVHKFVSMFVNLSVTGAYLWVQVGLPGVVAQLLALAMMFFEIVLGVAALRARSRKLAAVLALVVHASIFLFLGLRGANLAVWPWQFPLAIGGFVLMWRWEGSLGECLARHGRIVRAAIVLVLVSPFGFYFGLVDSYLAHCLYADNRPSALIRHVDGTEDPILFLDDTSALIPPEPRLFQAYFLEVGRSGETLVIKDSRWWMRWTGRDEREIRYPSRNR